MRLTPVLFGALALQVSSTIVQVERNGTSLSRSFRDPGSLLEAHSSSAAPSDYGGLNIFIAGATFGVLTCAIVFAFLVGCQVLRVVELPGGAVAESCQEPPPASQIVCDTPQIESLHLFWPRFRWLAAMMIFQSVASFILAHFQHLVESHADLIIFLTMLVGLGGNTGGQSVVLTCRKLALGEDVAIRNQLITGLLLGLALAPLAFARALLVKSEFGVCLTLAGATFLIATLAAGIGTVLPKLLQKLKLDPGQASAMIQVIMDITGIMITCLLGAAILR